MTKPVMKTRRFEFIGGTSAKFWEVKIPSVSASAPEVILRWGRIGRKGQEKTKLFTYWREANAFATKKIREKLAKGYVEVKESNDDYKPPPVGQEVNIIFIGNASSDPVEAQMGQMYLNTETNTLRMYTVAGWSEVAASTPGVPEDSPRQIHYVSKMPTGTISAGGRVFDFDGDEEDGGFDG